MSTSRLHRLLPTLAAALIACVATGLFLHTAAGRHERAEQLGQISRATSGTNANDPATRSRRPGSPVTTASRNTKRKTVPQQMQAIQETVDPLSQSRALLAAMRDFESDDFRVALESLASPLLGDVTGASSKLLEEWLRRDPDAAMMYAETRPVGIPNVIRMWSNADARALTTWLQKQAEGKRKEDLLIIAVPCIMKKDPDLATSLMAGLAEDVQQAIQRRLPQER